AGAIGASARLRRHRRGRLRTGLARDRPTDPDDRVREDPERPRLDTYLVAGAQRERAARDDPGAGEEDRPARQLERAPEVRHELVERPADPGARRRLVDDR